MVADHIAAVHAAVEQFNIVGGREGYFDLYDPACEVHGLPPGLPGTFAGLQTFYRTLWQSFPDVRIRVEDIFGDRDSLAVRFDARGTHTGPNFFTMPTDGKHTTFFVIMLLRFANGRAVERWWQMSIVE